MGKFDPCYEGDIQLMKRKARRNRKRPKTDAEKHLWARRRIAHKEAKTRREYASRAVKALTGEQEKETKQSTLTGGS